MADTQDKHSHSRAQGSRRRAQATTQPASRKLPQSTRKHRKHPKKQDRFHQMEEFKGKIVELIQIFTSGEYNSISVRFQDKTAVDFVIDPCFTLETDYTDWKTGNMRRLKRWPLIHSAGLRG